MTPRLCAEEVVVMMALDSTRRLGHGVWYFKKLSRKTNEEKLRFGLIKWQKIGRHPLRDKINCGLWVLNFDRQFRGDKGNEKLIIITCVCHIQIIAYNVPQIFCYIVTKESICPLAFNTGKKDITNWLTTIHWLNNHSNSFGDITFIANASWCNLAVVMASAVVVLKHETSILRQVTILY